MPDPVPAFLRTTLNEARRHLIDLTRRNRLLNFRPTRRTTLHVVDELPDQVWKLLVDGGRKLAFLATEEHELRQQHDRSEAHPAPTAEDTVPHGNAEEPTVPEDVSEEPAQDEDEPVEEFCQPAAGTALEEEPGEPLPGRYTDRFLQTDLRSEDLQTNLLRIEQAARSAIEERGVNLLFLAIGFLTWRDADQPDRSSRAPLILIPTTLERTSARHRFKVRALDDEPILNPCLPEKLREMGIELPAAGEDWTDFSVSGYLADVARRVASRPGWQVDDDIYLGFFSFVKYLMWVDLDPANWPEDKGPAVNPLVRRLCCTEDENQAPPANLSSGRTPADTEAKPEAPDTLDPREAFEVLSADSSQQQAILAARAGESFVLEGPPGTGKSQTIANLIAQSLADGKSVLFVSEKLAALEVVKRRLDAVELGDFCLELHSAKANRKSVVAELARVMEKGRYKLSHPLKGAEKLLQLRRRLNDYATAAHDPVGPAGVVPIEAIGRVSLLADVPDIPAELPGWKEWDSGLLAELRERLAGLARHAAPVSPPEQHAFRGCRLTTASRDTVTGIQDRSGELVELSERLHRSGVELGESLGATAAIETSADVLKLLEAEQLVRTSPLPDRPLLTEPIWDEAGQDVRALLELIDQCELAKGWFAERYRPEILDLADWDSVYRRAQRYWSSPLRWLRPTWWGDRKVLKQTRLEGHNPGFVEQVGDVKRLAEIQRLHLTLGGLSESGRRFFGHRWKGLDSDFAALRKMADWLIAFRRLMREGYLGPAAVDRATSEHEPPAEPPVSAKILTDWQNTADGIRDLLKLDAPDALGADWDAAALPRVADWARTLGGHADDVYEWAQYQHALQECRQPPLGEFVAAVLEEGLAPETLALALEKRFLMLWTEEAIARREALRQFNRTGHESDVRDFIRLDREWIARGGVRLHSRLAQQRPMTTVEGARTSQLGILQGEVRRKRGGRSIRRLLLSAGEAVQKLKPCFMMSPLSVAQFLSPDGLDFDVVVFDEASQVEPADALGAVSRARQLVLVGDDKQLPPTPFFSRMAGESDSGPTRDATLADMESILDQGSTVLPLRYLRWHYRSRHESLIAFSNGRFYDGRLVVFPSPQRGRGLGLELVYHPEDLYDRGRSQTNRAQARRVAEWVFAHLREHPELSLGVGAFSQRQQQAILDEVERLRREDDSLERFFDPNRHEPFFVKNLETIQGDERDVIALSVGYGRSEVGERLSMNFGPLNQDKGWRRLNVLITRARRRCVVFSSVVGEDFDLSATSAEGVHALKSYLDFARKRTDGKAVGDGGFRNAFVQAVYNALTEHGLQLNAGVGEAGASVDLAVQEGQDGGRFLLGIQCDGGAASESATARDRERTRREVLEGLGWRIHRVWALEWYRAPQREIDRVLEAVQAARSGRLKPLTPAASATPAESSLRFEQIDDGLDVQGYRCYSASAGLSAEQFYAASVKDLAETVSAAAEAEGPIREDELHRRLSTEYGFSRLGSKIEEKIGRAIDHAEKVLWVERRGRFVWPSRMQTPPVRRREDESLRDADLICDEEIAAAAKLLLEAQMGMGSEDLVVQVARVLGFKLTGPSIRQRIQDVLASAVARGELQEDDSGLLRPADSSDDQTPPST